MVMVNSTYEADALVPDVTRSQTAVILTVQDGQVLLFPFLLTHWYLYTEVTLNSEMLSAAKISMQHQIVNILEWVLASTTPLKKKKKMEVRC